MLFRSAELGESIEVETHIEPMLLGEIDGAEVPDADGKLLQGVAEVLKTKINGAIFLVGTRDASVALVAYVPKQLTAKFQANKLIQQVAPIVGGKGGGRPESAQGAGKDTSKVNEALAKARELLS